MCVCICVYVQHHSTESPSASPDWMSDWVMSCWVMSCWVMSCWVMSCWVMSESDWFGDELEWLDHAPSYCITLRHWDTQNPLLHCFIGRTHTHAHTHTQHTATHCNRISVCIALLDTHTHTHAHAHTYNTLQHTATRCNTLQQNQLLHCFIGQVEMQQSRSLAHELQQPVILWHKLIRTTQVGFDLCIYACVCEAQNKNEREREKHRAREREKNGVCVCLCVREGVFVCWCAWLCVRVCVYDYSIRFSFYIDLERHIE